MLLVLIMIFEGRLLLAVGAAAAAFGRGEPGRSEPHWLGKWAESWERRTKELVSDRIRDTQ
jgi:hypothetical protein